MVHFLAEVPVHVKDSLPGAGEGGGTGDWEDAGWLQEKKLDMTALQ